mmetsp:Transcript_35234/g.89179  ORF Transcript_35234/g.89179 Transcript_35234/m.89179 type:complete len:212 (-) Transcript_35234:517-1152(-)
MQHLQALIRQGVQAPPELEILQSSQVGQATVHQQLVTHLTPAQRPQPQHAQCAQAGERVQVETTCVQRATIQHQRPQTQQLSASTQHCLVDAPRGCHRCDLQVCQLLEVPCKPDGVHYAAHRCCRRDGDVHFPSAAGPRDEVSQLGVRHCLIWPHHQLQPLLLLCPCCLRCCSILCGWCWASFCCSILAPSCCFASQSCSVHSGSAVMEWC